MSTQSDTQSLPHGPKGRLRDIRAPLLWGVVWGGIQAVAPFGFWWVDPATVYIGFSVADGRWKVITAETFVAAAFVILGAVAVTGSAWLLVAGFAGHGLKDAWQYRTQFVTNTRWWPPFCAAIDLIAALLLAFAILAGIHFRS
jgi:hypothetical protein